MAADSLQDNVIAGSATVGVAALVAFILRIKARRLRGARLAADDYTMIPAVVLSWGVVICNIIATEYGLGRRIQTLSPTELVTFLKVFLTAQILWAVAIPVVKISILLQYLRIFGVIRYVSICAWILIAVTSAWGAMVVVVLLTKCQPVAYNWDKSLEGSCINETLFYKIGTALNVLGDFIILFLPMPAIWSLHVRLSKRLQIIAVFAIASMSCAFSTARFASLFQIKGDDPTHELAIPCIWSAVEPCLGTVAASLATTGPLIEHLKVKFVRESVSKSSTLVQKSNSGLRLSSTKGARRLRSTEDIALSDPTLSSKQHRSVHDA